MTVENISMINLNIRMLLIAAGVEPVTSWSPVRHASNKATKAGKSGSTLLFTNKALHPQMILSKQKQPYDICGQHRCKSACTYVQSDQSLH